MDDKYNILLIILDCLRFDRVTPRYMPFLAEFGEQNTTFSNFWGVSHCTDPSITALLSGKWPDELRLWSMMYEHKNYAIPDDVEMLAQTAKKYDYTTGMISNLGRWYTRGVDRYVDNRGWHGSNTFAHAAQMIKTMAQPWFLTVHADDMHTNYRGGSYDVACTEVDTDLCHLLSSITQDDKLKENTFVIVTSDHGEGLGEKGIAQHGFGLWPFLTHLPCILRGPDQRYSLISRHITQHVDLYGFMADVIEGKDAFVISRDYAYMVGRTPKWWHRGVTDGKTLLIKEQDAKDGTNPTWYIVDLETGAQDKRVDKLWEDILWDAARWHAARFGINADDDKLADEEILEQRLRALGYFG